MQRYLIPFFDPVVIRHEIRRVNIAARFFGIFLSNRLGGPLSAHVEIKETRLESALAEVYHTDRLFTVRLVLVVLAGAVKSESSALLSSSLFSRCAFFDLRLALGLPCLAGLASS